MFWPGTPGVASATFRSASPGSAHDLFLRMQASDDCMFLGEYIRFWHGSMSRNLGLNQPTSFSILSSSGPLDLSSQSGSCFQLSRFQSSYGNVIKPERLTIWELSFWSSLCECQAAMMPLNRQ